MRLTEAAYVAERSIDTARDWRQAQQALNAHLLESASNKRFFMKQTFFEEGEQAGHMLVSIAKAQMGPSFIVNLRGTDDVLVSDSADTQRVMCDFYQTLYSSRLVLTPTQIAIYLRDISLSELSDAQGDFLDAPIQLEELQQVVSSLANNKSPGVDGLPNELY